MDSPEPPTDPALAGSASPAERLVPLAVACVFIALGVWRATAVGDADATGIVEEPLGGAGTAVFLAGLFIGIPAVVAGVVDGLIDRVRRGGTRIVLRIVVVGGFGLWAGLWVWALADIDCDGSCTEAEPDIVVAAAVTAFALLLVEAAIGWLVGRRARVRRSEDAATTS
ncbi:MAG: hypothetical protein WDA60_02150 [Acidimicrobiia bacterium]|jgi:hypothetical protein